MSDNYISKTQLKTKGPTTTAIYVTPSLLIALDTISAIFSCYLALQLTPYQEATSQLPYTYLYYFFTISIIGMSHSADLHNPRAMPAKTKQLKKIIIVTSLSISAAVFILHFILFQHVGRVIYGLVFVFNVVLMFATRECIRVLFLKKRKYIVSFAGSQDFASNATEYVREHADNLILCYRMPFENAADTRQDALDEIVFETNTQLMELDPKIYFRLMNSGTRINCYADFIETLSLKIPVSHIDASWLTRLQYDWGRSNHRNAMKRLFDISMAFIALAICLPILILLLIAIKLDSPGPALYTQTRVGKNGKNFTILKLRTMKTDSEANGAVWAKSHDPRITKLGYFLRKTRLDELPQFLNILIGDMSFIGPRPERPEFVHILSEEIPFYDFRHLIKPGLSGWAQINYPYGSSIQDSKNKLEYDLYYVKNYNLGFDVKIALRTLVSAIQGSK